MTTLFISDLHLAENNPALTAQFFQFLETTASKAEALYILGDFFDYWIGDDDRNPWVDIVIEKLRALSARGVKLYLMGGNRDFLLGKNFAKYVGGVYLKDPTLISLYGTPVLLVHGDGLCTDDHAYQRFRAFVQNPVIKAIYLALPLRVRQAIAHYLRRRSTASNQHKSYRLMDVSQTAVEDIMRRHQVLHLIHGHTHAPKIAEFDLEGKTATRIVLSAWDHAPSVLVYTPSGATFESI